MSLVHKGIQPSRKCIEAAINHHKGKPRSEETKLKISLANTGKLCSEEHRQKIIKAHNTSEMKQWHCLNRSKQIFPVKDTDIEIKVKNYLVSNGMIEGIDFITHKSFCINWPSFHQVDIFIPRLNLAIECDGEYWHSTPEAMAKDSKIDFCLRSKNIIVLRLSGTSIHSGNFIYSLKEFGL